MVSMNSTLVETVSINYEDFNESFLTCGTCLCTYDGGDHTPKLLQCSHTVCLHCLSRIAQSQTRDTGTFRCPICRELIQIPRGGVSALPPSFLVNQLLDLMSRQRRDVIPKCSVHSNQELLFCETCDSVFCTLCTKHGHLNEANNSNSTGTNGTNGPDSSINCEHTIIPFSIAIKRMSEILLYKANECIAKLTQAQDGVQLELDKLDSEHTSCQEQINAKFQQLQLKIDQRKLELVEDLNKICLDKRKILQEQHTLIESEKLKVEQECHGLQYQIEVRNITQRIEILTNRLDSVQNLSEPRENAFLKTDFRQCDYMDELDAILHNIGRVRTSTTFPSLCTAQIKEPVVAGLETCVQVKTIDYHGMVQKNGGDPIDAQLSYVNDAHCTNLIPLRITDLDDGTYSIVFRTNDQGRYKLNIQLFERPIKDSPLFFNVSQHNNPLLVYGTKGSAKDEFMQPVALAVDCLEGWVYVLDTGNSRIKVLDKELHFQRHLTNEGLLGRSCTGIAISSTNTILVVNWRTRFVTEMCPNEGTLLKSFTNDQFQEPIDLAVDKTYGHILVADNGTSSCVFVLDCDGKLLFKVGKKGTFNIISAVTVGPLGDIIVADSRIQVFSPKGDFLATLYDEGKGKGRFGGLSIDAENRLLASKTEQKGKSYVQLFDLNDPNIRNCIDSNDSKLKRASGVAVTGDNHLFVVDLGNHCVKKYRYW